MLEGVRVIVEATDEGAHAKVLHAVDLNADAAAIQQAVELGPA